jgi:hypothetical protein
MGFEATSFDADRDRYPRYYVNRRSRMFGPSGEVAVWTVDISGNGARVGLGMLDSSDFEGPGWSLDIPDIGRFPVHLQWHRGDTFGLGFALSQAEQDDLALTLRYQYRKQVMPGTIAG